MVDTIISLRIDKQIHERMKQAQHIKWSAILRQAIKQQIEMLEENNFNFEKAKKSLEDMNKIRKSRIFDKGKSSVEIIREWRNKRRS
jgi:hypothetical protein